MEARPAFAEAASVLPPAPLDRLALLLDLDGTLIDFASTPGEVQVPAGLPEVLCLLGARLGGALGIVTGRTIEEVAALLGGAAIAIAGEHGAAVRRAPGQTIERPALPEVPARWLEAAQQFAEGHPGLLLEAKPHGFVVHYRRAEAAGPEVAALLRELLSGSDEGFVLVPAAMAWEVRPRGVDKGGAVRMLCDRPPFAGRIPLFIGDDVTDEDGIRAARELGGAGLRVADSFGDAAGVRDWLRRLAETGESREKAS